MHSVNHTLIINSSPEKVWAYLVDPTNFAEWSSTCQSSDHVSEGDIRVGSRVREVRNLLGVQMESTYEITELVDTPERKILGTKVLDGPVPFQFKWTLEPAADGTRFTGEGGGQWTDAHDDELVESAAQKGLEHDMDMLKHLVEAR